MTAGRGRGRGMVLQCCQSHQNGAVTLKWPIVQFRHVLQLCLLLAPIVYYEFWRNLMVARGTFAPWHVYSYTAPYEPPSPYPDSLQDAIVSWDGSNRPRVVVTLSTLPHRMESINETLHSLVRQSLRPDVIYLNIPYIAKRMNRTYVIPDSLAAWSDITIIRCDDIGPATKLIPALRAEPDPSTLVITVDDDHVYPIHFIRQLVWFATFDPRVVWAVNGWSFLFTPGVHNVMSVYAPLEVPVISLRGRGRYVDVCQAVAGIAYRRGFFTDLTLLSNPHPACFTTDDMWFSGVLATVSGVRRVAIPKVFNSAADSHLFLASTASWRTREQAKKSDTQWSLSAHNSRNNQDIRCIDGVQERFGQAWPVAADYQTIAPPAPAPGVRIAK